MIHETHCKLCGEEFHSDSVRCYRRINGKPCRLCKKCFDSFVEIPIVGTIIKDEKFGNRVKYNSQDYLQ